MRFQPLALNCECGLRPLRVRQVGLTPQHQLVVLWWCPNCRRNISVVKDLADCWRDCPKPEDFQETAPVDAAGSPAEDTDFLHRLGVRFPDPLE
jgi:hypothetical protein